MWRLVILLVGYFVQKAWSCSPGGKDKNAVAEKPPDITTTTILSLTVTDSPITTTITTTPTTTPTTTTTASATEGQQGISSTEVWLISILSSVGALFVIVVVVIVSVLCVRAKKRRRELVGNAASKHTFEKLNQKPEVVKVRSPPVSDPVIYAVVENGGKVKESFDTTKDHSEKPVTQDLVYAQLAFPKDEMKSKKRKTNKPSFNSDVKRNMSVTYSQVNKQTNESDSVNLYANN